MPLKSISAWNAEEYIFFIFIQPIIIAKNLLFPYTNTKYTEYYVPRFLSLRGMYDLSAERIYSTQDLYIKYT